MADTTSKSIAARLPLDEYRKLVNRAEELKIAVSDYLIMKINLSDIGEDKNEVVELSKKLDLTKRELQKERNKITKITNEFKLKIEEYENEIKELRYTNYHSE